MRIAKVTDRISYIGVNDRRTALFENNWPIPYGVSYNSYIIKDEKNVLIDTVEYGSDGDFLCKIEALLVGRKLDYLVVNHMEPDHSGMIRSVLAKYPDLKIIGNAKTFELMQKYYGIPQEAFLQVADGQELSIGSTSLRFWFVPWVHWPETMVTLDMADGVLFTCDAFGGYGSLDGGIFDSDYNMEEMFLPEMRRYYSNIVAKYNQMVTRAITKLADVPANCYVLSDGDEEGVIGFYKYNGNQLNAHKAYIIFSGSNNAPRRMRFIFAEEQTATGAESATTNVESRKVIENGQLVIIHGGVRYNAAGQVIE